MNILILSPFFPFPLDQGGRIRVFNIIKHLSRDHKVTLACLCGEAVVDYGPLKEYCGEIIAVERRPALVHDLLYFLFSREPFNYVSYSSPVLRKELQRLCKRKTFDLIQIEFSTMWQYADLFKGIPVVLDAHNIESKIIRQVREFYKNPVRKLLYSLEEEKLRRKEERAWRECSLCFTVSDDERIAIASHLGQSDKAVTISNGVDPARFEFILKKGTDRRLLLLGGMRFQPNLDSALYFLDSILPVLREKLPEVKLDIVGRELRRINNHASYQGVEFHEDVPDALPYFRKADALVVPLRHGAGTRIKILEAMAAGLPVVTTSKGCEGLEVKHAEHLLIADSPDAFAAAVTRVIKDADLRRTMSRKARTLVEERYSWDGLVGLMAGRYENLVKRELHT
jgi:glycosyltransferase involved in cell wall biosynthesis